MLKFYLLTVLLHYKPCSFKVCINFIDERGQSVTFEQQCMSILFLLYEFVNESSPNVITCDETSMHMPFVPALPRSHAC